MFSAWQAQGRAGWRSSRLECMFVETFETFTYICAGRQLSNNMDEQLGMENYEKDHTRSASNNINY